MARLKVIAGGQLVDPSADIDKKADLYIEKGNVSRVETKQLLTPEDLKQMEPGEFIDATGMIISPGLIDMHVHLREPGKEKLETIQTGSEAAAAGGFTTICCMPNTTPTIDNQETVKFILSRARQAPVRVYPISAITKGQKGKELAEIGEVVAAGAIALTDDGYPVQSAEMMRKAFDYARMFKIPVIEHPEDLSLSGDGVMNEGYTSMRLGMKGVPFVSEEVCVSRDLLLARYTGGRIHFAHISTAGAVELIRQAKKADVDVTAEVTPHHLSLTDDLIAEDFDPNLKMSPPLRTETDVRALIKGLLDGTLDCIASDHAPHSHESKDVEFDLAPNGVIGLETSLGVCSTYLIKEKHLKWTQLIRAMSTRPAQILSLNAGSLQEGFPADIAIIDPGKEWIVNPERFLSRSRNTPYAGQTLTGKAVYTIVDGKVVYKDV
jgi:dihydroorotase